MLALVTGGWAFQWRYDEVRGPAGKQFVRTNRFTGAVQLFGTETGWYSPGVSTGGPVVAARPCPSDRRPTPYDDLVMDCDPSLKAAPRTATQ